MIINKTASIQDNYLLNEYYYNSAREGMFDLLNNMLKNGMISTLLLPGYIGWSPKEGSGIFDPVSNLCGLSIQYYKVTSDLSIDIYDLENRIKNCKQGNFAVLIVNYFGFVDKQIQSVSNIIRKYAGWIVEDNAHGFFTYYNRKEHFSDATFFSLHKMFPFTHGGSLVIKNNELIPLKYSGGTIKETEFNPWQYDIQRISVTRCENYLALEEAISKEGDINYFVPMKHSLSDNVPQTFPICIRKGNRNKVYELMNDAGFGVVSLYHTLIEPLRCSQYNASFELSRVIMNLPVHQDVDKRKYKEMIIHLLKYCDMTANE